MKNLPFDKLQHSTQQALLNDPAIMTEISALRVYVPSRRHTIDASAAVRFYCERVAAGDPTPTATTAQRYGVTDRRIRQLTQGVRDGSRPFTASLDDSPALRSIEQAKSASALAGALKGKGGANHEPEVPIGSGLKPDKSNA